MAALSEMLRFQGRGTINHEAWHQILDLLVYKGWELREGDRRMLVPIRNGALVHCFDGRPATKDTDPDLLIAIRVPGAMQGVAALSRKIRRRGSQESLFLQTCKVIRDAGYIPTAHGDTKHGARGCGFVNLWRDGQFEGLHEMPILPEHVQELAANDPRLLYLTLTGEHREKEMEIVLRDGMTRVPDGKAFQLTAWAGPSLGIDPYHMVFAAMDTVEKLNGPRKAVIYR